MRRRRFALVLLLAVCAPSLGHAADERGGFSIRGAGLLSCAVYTQERAKRSETYYMIGGWLDGYLTAINQYSPETYDVASFETTELFTEIIQNHCADHPDHRVFAVMNTLIMRIRDDRLRTGSPFVKIAVGDRSAQLYLETLRRAQQELKRLGHYTGEINGQFNDGTRAAFALFQKSIGFNGTGFPDQTTLWRLLRREPAQN